MYNRYAQEFIFRQPQNFHQFLSVLDAANVEVFDSYACNGNEHWTYEKCKEWWESLPNLIVALKDPEVRAVNGDRIDLYFDYLKGPAEADLRCYCYFLLNGVYPVNYEMGSLPML